MNIKYQNKTEWRNKQAQLHRIDETAVIYENGKHFTKQQYEYQF